MVSLAVFGEGSPGYFGEGGRWEFGGLGVRSQCGPAPPQALTNHSSLLELARPLAGPRQLLLEVELLRPGPRPPHEAPPSATEDPPPSAWDPPPPAGRGLALLRLHLSVGAHPF